MYYHYISSQVKRSMFSKQSQEMLNGVTLHLNIAFGTYQIPIKKNILFVGDG